MSDQTIPDLTVVRDGDDANVAKSAATSAAKVSKPKRPLPTNRIALDKQFDLIRAWAIAGAEGRATTNKEVAVIIKLHTDTLGLQNGFFLDIGILEKKEGGYAPSDAALAYNQAFAWQPESAGLKLAQVIKNSWFASVILPRIQMQPISRASAIAELAAAVQADKVFKPQIEMLLGYLERAGLVALDGEMVKLATSTLDPTPPPVVEESAERREVPPRPAVSTAFAQSTEGQVSFNVSLRVSMSELAGWEAPRISAFFAGLAQVLAAKSGIEQEATET